MGRGVQIGVATATASPAERAHQKARLQRETGLKEVARCLVVEVAEQDGVLSPGVKVLEDVGQGRSHDTAAIRGDSVLRAELQARLLEGHEIVAGTVEGDLLLVLGRFLRRSLGLRVLGYL